MQHINTLLDEIASLKVSILTRPGGRVQLVGDTDRFTLPSGFNPHPSRRTGATFATWMISASEHRFQSSPVPEDGCNRKSNAEPSSSAKFQSSPVPEDGCNSFMAEAGIALVGFNPHPSRRTGATSTRSLLADFEKGFNPHPSRRTGATAAASR